ncbi:helix-turn-helix protein [Haloactinospora alba]|uniref:Helix-turn-helix protein n=1 Tax=Haloactinospora alba TaxID=405555 RepID=A0A543NMW2_9ACTN|nr:helix-turn-helix transcriptional regulator [Haloactinospora alba]TQN33163.1 helix-turn-helix protein [Haloactinospora alba]
MSTRQVHSPTVRLRRLATELRRARHAAGYAQIADAASALGWSGPKLSRLEAAETRYIKSHDLDKVMDLYAITAQGERDALHALAREARQRGWWSRYRDVFEGNALPDFEAEASTIRTYEGLVVPGLLQTAEYTEEVFRGGQAHTDEIVERHVAARIERQQILHRQRPPHLWAVIDEAALRRRTADPRTMSDQIQHLLNLATRHNIDLQVLPFNAGMHAGLAGSFVIMEFPGPLDPAIVFNEHASGSLFIEEPDAVAEHAAVFNRVQAAALPAPRSLDYLRSIQTDIEGDNHDG